MLLVLLELHQTPATFTREQTTTTRQWLATLDQHFSTALKIPKVVQDKEHHLSIKKAG